MYFFIFFLIIDISYAESEANPTTFIDRRVEIEDCDDPISTATNDANSKLKCVTSNQILKLGSQDQVIIQSVTYSQLTDKGKDTVCKKIRTSKNYEVEIKSKEKLKSIVYQVDKEGKALLFGTNTSVCYQNSKVTIRELESGYLHVTSIKCVAKDIVTEYHSSKSSVKPKEFLEADNRICFIASMLKKDTTLKVTFKSKVYPLTISATPKQECPKCPAAETNSTKSTNTTDSSTHAASTSTTIIVVVVVVIVIFLIGGIGFFMMKK